MLHEAIQGIIPLLTNWPTNVFHLEVTHLHLGEDSCPSIAKIKASKDWLEVISHIKNFLFQVHFLCKIVNFQGFLTEQVNLKNHVVMMGMWRHFP